VERLLLPLRDFRKRYPGAPGGYELRIDCPDRSLLFVGFQHSTEPTNPSFRALEKLWQRYERESAGRRRTVLVEGRVRTSAANRDAAIREAGGEGGLVSFLAKRDGVDALASPEPASDDTARALRARFSQEEICYSTFARSIALWHAQGTRTPLDTFVAELPLPRASGCDFTVAAMGDAHARLLGGTLDPNDAAFFRRVTDPTHDETVVGRVLAEETRQRDRHIVRELEQRFAAGASLFAVYGTAHVVMQEPALRVLLCRRCEPGSCRTQAAPTLGGADPRSSAASTP
jgi:hypothetical protein